ncbi:YncE family protein [Alsobacter sp. SYSU M60028]|uniref:YncE family protein n=1 Tax=Alsobacter ponti TaxID=2962936 RepID=A0ABT1L8Y0_9HYPH|nr:YncE family protein [Alsobacter ponti]MCP8937388.1 YncE family protein [Alsobacter ponti]
MREATSTVLALAAALACAPLPAPAAELTVEAHMPLGAVKGRIDHLAVDVEGRRLFVAELGNDSVSVVDLRAGKVVHRIEGLAEPQGVGWEPGARTLWIANARDGSVRVFEGANLAPLGRVDLGDDADNVRISEGRIFVGYGSGAIAIVDKSSRKVIETLPLSTHPEGFQIAPGAGQAFVNLADAGSIAVLDIASHRTLASWRTDGVRGNFPLALAPQGEWLVVASRRPATLLRYSSDGALRWRAQTCEDADDVFIDPRRPLIYVVCGEGLVAVHNAGDGNTLERVKTSPGARTGLYVPEMDRLFVAAPTREREAEILVLKLADK